MYASIVFVYLSILMYRVVEHFLDKSNTTCDITLLGGQGLIPKPMIIYPCREYEFHNFTYKTLQLLKTKCNA